MAGVDRSRTVVKILEPHEFLFRDDNDIEEYIKSKGREITRMMVGNFKKFGTAYTLFSPDEDFQKGKWFNFSPSYWVGLDYKKEVETSILSGLLYYLWPEEIPSYTELWLQQISSKIPYSLQIVMKNNGTNDFVVEKNDDLKLINIYFSQTIMDNLNKFHTQATQILKSSVKTGQVKNNIGFENQKDGDQIIGYDFRKIEDILIDNKEKIQKDIKSAYGCYNIEGIIQELSAAFKKENILEGSDGIEVEQVAGLLIKFLLIGPKCCVAFRILNPKQFIRGDKYLGNFAGILRVYDYDDNLEQKLMEVYPLAYSIINNLSFRIVSHFMEKFRLIHALHSAVAAIMARNMSHNIGSHVLNSVSVTPQNLVEMQNLTKYVQQRMDFIAMITSEFPSWTFPARFVWDIMSWFYKQSLILDYIAEGEGLRAYDFTKNGSQKNRLKVKVILKKIGEKKPIDITALKDGNFEDVWVAIPGGIIGFQAIYVILEGIIRNSAKHGWVQKKKNNLKNLEITIEITDDPEKDYVTVFVGDNIEQEGINKGNADTPPSEYVNKDEQKDWPIHWKMNKKIIEPLIKTTGEIAPENWGIKELKIAAAFLQRNFNILQVSNESIFFKQNGESFTGLIKAKAVPKKEDKNSYTFGYEFAIPKPKEVMIDKNLKPLEGKNG